MFVRYRLNVAPQPKEPFVIVGSPPFASRAEISGGDSGHASYGRACRDRHRATRCDFAGRRIAARTSICLGSSGRGHCNSPRCLPLGRRHRGARGLDRWTRHDQRAILGRRANPRSSRQSPELVESSGRTSEMRWLQHHGSHGFRARGNGDGKTLPGSAGRRNSIRRTYHSYIHGKSAISLENSAEELRLEKNAIRRTSRGFIGADQSQRSIIGVEQENRDRDSCRFVQWKSCARVGSSRQERNEEGPKTTLTQRPQNSQRTTLVRQLRSGVPANRAFMNWGLTA